MASPYAGEIRNTDGTVIHGGLLAFTDAANQPGGSGIALVTVGSAAPVAFTTPLVFDDTATTGGLYAWDGSAYQKVGLATT